MKKYDKYSDIELVQFLNSGDENAFTEMYNRYWERLLYIAGIKLRNLAIAEELVQDIFFDIWNRRATLHLQGELAAYLAVSMKYKIINAQATLKRALDYQRFAAVYQGVQDRGTEDWLNFAELKNRLSKLVAALPEKCRITYQLSREYGLSQKEIARRLDVTEKAVEGNLSRALKSLRAGLNFIVLSFLVLWRILP